MLLPHCAPQIAGPRVAVDSHAHWGRWSTYPGDDAVGEAAGERCYDAFAGFVGTNYESSVCGFTTLSPSEASWDQIDDREVLCLVANYDGTKKTGTARNTRI